MRTAALWFPNWPVQAVRRELGLQGPVAIARGERIHVHTGGLRRGMPVRQARALLPGVQILQEDPDRDARAFADIAAGLDDVAASVEILRPGLVLADATAAARFHGSESRAAEMLLDAAARAGIDMRLGIATEIPTAILAARCDRIVDDSRTFLAPLALSMLSAFDDDPNTLNALQTLGISTLGELAALPAQAVATRFGEAGMRYHRIASASPSRRVAPALEVQQIRADMIPEEPIERVDAAAFAGRQLAAELHRQLSEAGLVCVRLKIIAECEEGTSQRTWRMWRALDEAGTADRVRWQLDGWLNSGGTGAIVALSLVCVETARPSVQELWSRAEDGDQQAQRHRVLSRVQSTLGVERVCQPHHVGGRGVAERIELHAYGEVPETRAPGPWPGRIPDPLPARLGPGTQHPAARIRLIDAEARDVYVTAEALLSSTPYALAWGAKHYLVTAWAGPWPVDMGWWERDNPVARLQVLGRTGPEATERGWLLVWAKGWRVEALYA